MRDRLIELLKSPHKAEQLRKMGVAIGKYEDDCVETMIADFLLANGVIVSPCKVGATIYHIDKSCDANNGLKDEDKCSPEFDKNCEFFEDDYWEQPHYCKKLGSFEGDYCKFNLDIVCDNCKGRLCIQKDVFDYGKMTQIYGTPMFNKNTNLYNTYFLSEAAAEDKLRELKGENK